MKLERAKYGKVTCRSHFSTFHLVFTPKSDVTSRCDRFEGICIREDAPQIASSHIHENLPPFFLSFSRSRSLSVRPIWRGFTLLCGISNAMSFFSESAYAPTHMCPVSPIVNPTCQYQSKSMKQLRVRQEPFGKPRIMPSLTRIQSLVIDIWFRAQTFSDVPLNCSANLWSYESSNISPIGFYDYSKN